MQWDNTSPSRKSQACFSLLAASVTSLSLSSGVPVNSKQIGGLFFPSTEDLKS